MDGTLPSYEAAMRDAREYLRRRDLNSQDEIPLYFAWERLYAAANANLSTDFLNETCAELRARQQARLAPRQGLPPPLFTSFDKLNRKSMQSSAFLRSSLSSDAAIEMMARRYRREAEKLRSSRDKLVTSSLSDVGKRGKKGKRGKRMPQEVDELLEDFERPSSTENNGFVTSKLMKDGTGATSGGGAKRTRKINGRQRNPEREVEELLAKFENANLLPERKMSASTKAKSKDRLDLTGGKDSFADELAAGANMSKVAELRRSSFPMGNPATDPVLADVENVAVFAAQVSDWRMRPRADAATSPSKPVQKGETLTPKGNKRVSRMRKPAAAEGEADTTFDTSLGSSGPDEDNITTHGSLRSSAVSTSPTSRRSTARTSEWEDDDEDNMSVDEDQLAVHSSAKGESSRVQPAADAPHSNSSDARPDKPAVLTRSSGVGEQLSHAVGDMQVKISGREIQVTFKGSLNDGNRDGISNATHTDGNSHSNTVKQPSATQKVFGTTDTIADGSKENEQDFVEQPVQRGITSSRDANVPRKPSSVRFSGVGDDDVNEDVSADRALSDNKTSPGDQKLLDIRDSSVLSAPTELENYQNRSATVNTRNGATARKLTEADSLYNDAFNGEAAEPGSVEYHRSSDNLRTQQVDRERGPVVDDHAGGDLRASATRVDLDKSTADDQRKELSDASQERRHSIARDHQGGEPAQLNEAFHPATRGSATTRSKTNARPESAATQSALEADSVTNGTIWREPASKLRGQQIDPDEVHDTNDHDSGDSRTSMGRSKRRISTASDRNEVLADVSQRHRRPTTRDHRREAPTRYKEDIHAGMNNSDVRPPKRSNSSRSKSFDERPQFSEPHQESAFDEEVSSEEEEEHDVARRNIPDQRSKQKSDNRPSPRDDSRSDTIQVGADVRRQSSAVKRNSSSSGTRRSHESSIELSDDDGDFSGDDEPERGRSSSKLRAELSSEEESADSTRAAQRREKKGAHSSRRSRNQEVIVDETNSTSDEDLSDGPDTPDIEEYHRQERRYKSGQQQWRIPRDTHEHADRGRIRRHSSSTRLSSSRKSSSRPPYSRHSNSRHKQRKHSPDSSNDRSDSNYDSRSEVQKPDRRHRSDTAQRARSETLSRDRRHSSRYSAYDLRDRDHHLAAALESPPKRSKPKVRTKQDKLGQARNQTRSGKPTSRSLKLPEGIVWPPGMEAECIARLGLDGHHPIAPPGLEHLVTDEQWGDYWTWLHWYSSWQMWYMTNDKKPKRRSDKEKRSGRQHIESDGESDRHEKRNANWWVDVGPSKRSHRD